jgi:hypothetical protein
VPKACYPALSGKAYYPLNALFILERIIVDITMAVIYAVLGIFDSIRQFDLVAFVVLVVIGLIIILLIRLILILIPAVLLAILVWFLTNGDLYWAGITFLVVAALSLLKKLL